MLVMEIYVNDKGERAKVLWVDDRAGIASVVIDGKTKQLPWVEFLKEFGVRK